MSPPDAREAETSPSASLSLSNDPQHDERTRAVPDDLPDIDLEELLGNDDEDVAFQYDQTLTLPAHVAGSGSLGRLVDQACGYAEAATVENTNKAYRADWKHFANWCRRKGVDALVPSSAVIGLYISDCAKPQDGSPALSVSTIERRLSAYPQTTGNAGLPST